jgi:hypothetical protein
MAEVHAKMKHYGSTADPVAADDEAADGKPRAAGGHG